MMIRNHARVATDALATNYVRKTMVKCVKIKISGRKFSFPVGRLSSRKFWPLRVTSKWRLDQGSLFLFHFFQLHFQNVCFLTYPTLNAAMGLCSIYFSRTSKIKILLNYKLYKQARVSQHIRMGGVRTCSLFRLKIIIEYNHNFKRVLIGNV